MYIFLGFLATFICFCVSVLFYRYLYFVVNQIKLQSCIVAKILERFKKSMVELYCDFKHANKFLPLRPVDCCLLEFAL